VVCMIRGWGALHCKAAAGPCSAGARVGAYSHSHSKGSGGGGLYLQGYHGGRGGNRHPLAFHVVALQCADQKQRPHPLQLVRRACGRGPHKHTVQKLDGAHCIAGERAVQGAMESARLSGKHETLHTITQRGERAARGKWEGAHPGQGRPREPPACCPPQEGTPQWVPGQLAPTTPPGPRWPCPRPAPAPPGPRQTTLHKKNGNAPKPAKPISRLE
jgi:hypothetical protein